MLLESYSPSTLPVGGNASADPNRSKSFADGISS